MARAQVQRKPRGAARARLLPRGAWALVENAQFVPREVLELEALRALSRTTQFVFEPLLAGARVLVAKDGVSVHVVNEAKRSLTRELGRLVAAIAACEAFPATIVLDATLVALDASGKPSLDALARALQAGSDRELLLVVTDVLRVGEQDLADEAPHVRRSRLGPCTLPPHITWMTSLGEDFELAHRAMTSVGLDGLVARPTKPGLACIVAVREPATPIAPRSLSPAPKLSNPSKVLFPRDGLTKKDLFAYYADVAEFLLPLMADRPVVLQRWPDGIDEFMWFQHRVPPRAPDYVRVLPIEGNRRIAIDGSDALLWLVNQAAITFHGFVSRASSLTHPDWLVVDLDPPDTSAWPRVIQVALSIRKLLDLLEVTSVVKTSGQKGLHVLVPLAAKQDAATVKLAARGIVDLIERLLPSDTTQEMDREKRRGRIFLDASQGHVGKTLVLPYSVRGVDGATVSAPLSWDEVTPSLDPRAFGVRSMRARLDRRGDLARPLSHGEADVRRLLDRLSARAT